MGERCSQSRKSPEGKTQPGGKIKYGKNVYALRKAQFFKNKRKKKKKARRNWAVVILFVRFVQINLTRHKTMSGDRFLASPLPCSFWVQGVRKVWIAFEREICVFD